MGLGPVDLDLLRNFNNCLSGFGNDNNVIVHFVARYTRCVTDDDVLGIVLYINRSRRERLHRHPFVRYSSLREANSSNNHGQQQQLLLVVHSLVLVLSLHVMQKHQMLM